MQLRALTQAPVARWAYAFQIRHAPSVGDFFHPGMPKGRHRHRGRRSLPPRSGSFVDGRFDTWASFRNALLQLGPIGRTPAADQVIDGAGTFSAGRAAGEVILALPDGCRMGAIGGTSSRFYSRIEWRASGVPPGVGFSNAGNGDSGVAASTLLLVITKKLSGKCRYRRRGLSRDDRTFPPPLNRVGLRAFNF